MCLVKTPRVTPAAAADRPPQVFTNRYFVERGADGVAARAGRNALRIDRTSMTPSAPPIALTPPNTAVAPGIQIPLPSGPQAPTMPRVPGGGGGGGGRDYNPRSRVMIR